MIIQSMFKEDINRKINGVVKVDQDEKNVLVQELKEYVITRELRKHFYTFFNNYVEALNEETADIGVWISGFFGSGKSHFLKMLSYLLENKEVEGITTVEYFQQKFDDDPDTFKLIETATKAKIDTILFNIDIEGSINKDKTAVLRVFAKMFYNYLGFYGENLKVAKLEQFVDKKGKTEEFRRVFEEKNGSSWLESREAYAFLEDDIVATLQEVLGMSQQSASNWFNSEETVETSIAQLVSEIKEYVESKPKDFRLLFMIDEVGQYVGGDTDLLINLQSLVEKIGSECVGKVWVVCTGQEAIDEIIKARENEFSRIQARFKTRLSLSSSSVDEVIQKRILLKTVKAEKELEQLYDSNISVLRNLFSFTDSVSDIKGYESADEFAKNFPFVPYQFILMQNVFAEIRKHGNSGKHLSGGERSMLSGFQEAAQKIEDKDEYALAPFYLFYDTVHSFLDSSIRRVIERCQRAAQDGNGIESQDVDVLKLLYLIRYVNDIKSNLDNIVILMADDLRLDKIIVREKVQASLDRLLKQSYIGRQDDTYVFLTDEEQDIQREINHTLVSSADIVNKISQMIFADIYTSKKFRYGKYDFAFDQMVDTQAVGNLSNGLLLQVLTVATDPIEKNELRLMTYSYGKALVVLPGDYYYRCLENSMKIRKYVKQRNVSQLPRTIQNIIKNHQDEAGKYEIAAAEDLKRAITHSAFYVDGEHLDIRSGEAKNRIDQALEYLVTHVYSELGLIKDFAETDQDIIRILKGDKEKLFGSEANRDAATLVDNYLEVQANQKISITMSDLQDRYQKKPYGWREIDIAAVVAMLIYEQKVTVKYGGMTVQPSDPKLPDMLRKKSEIGRTSISKRQVVSIQKMRQAREILRELFYAMDVPSDEDGFVAYIINKFETKLNHFKELEARYLGHSYPDEDIIKEAIELCNDILLRKKDNIALVNRIIDKEDDLFDLQEKLQNIEDFFKSRVNLFDEAVDFIKRIEIDNDYIEKDEEAKKAVTEIDIITTVTGTTKFRYNRIPELNELIAKVKKVHSVMLEEKRKELVDIVHQCKEQIHALAGDNAEAIKLANNADVVYNKKELYIASYLTLNSLDGLEPQMWKFKDECISKIEEILHPPVVEPSQPEPKPVITSVESKAAVVSKAKKPEIKKEVIKSYRKEIIFTAKLLKTDSDIDNYVEEMRAKLKSLLKSCDGIKLS